MEGERNGGKDKSRETETEEERNRWKDTGNKE